MVDRDRSAPTMKPSSPLPTMLTTSSAGTGAQQLVDGVPQHRPDRRSDDEQDRGHRSRRPVGDRGGDVSADQREREIARGEPESVGVEQVVQLDGERREGGEAAEDPRHDERPGDGVARQLPCCEPDRDAPDQVHDQRRPRPTAGMPARRLADSPTEPSLPARPRSPPPRGPAQTTPVPPPTASDSIPRSYQTGGQARAMAMCGAIDRTSPSPRGGACRRCRCAVLLTGHRHRPGAGGGWVHTWLTPGSHPNRRPGSARMGRCRVSRTSRC